MEDKVVTLAHHLKKSGADAELQKLILTYAYTALDAQHQFPKYLRGTMGDKNKYGEVVAKLDDWVNGFLCDNLIKTGLVRKIYSEELKEPLTANPNAPFVITMDPLDGSSNISTNNPIGSIFGVYREDLPLTGRKLVAALYKLYGPMNTLVYTIGKGTHEFVKHYDSDGNAEFQLLFENLKVKEPGEVFGIGGEPLDWDSNFMKFAKDLFKTEKLKARYSGAFVADLSQILHRGGFFAYPSTKKSPKGKLRLVYEAAPMSFIWENAGGASYDGSKGSLLDAKETNVDARVPLYLGNKHLIEKLKK
ncbi:MAG: fructose-1,6-bisphosphatase, partial [Candidatus Micrarchaeota archaeon]|nr:fructose-1,6-bisphosphatase [Candidatus Micrarchaeota archaeon]